MSYTTPDPSTWVPLTITPCVAPCATDETSPHVHIPTFVRDSIAANGDWNLRVPADYLKANGELDATLIRASYKEWDAKHGGAKLTKHADAIKAKLAP